MKSSENGKKASQFDNKAASISPKYSLKRRVCDDSSTKNLSFQSNEMPKNCHDNKAKSTSKRSTRVSKPPERGRY